ncbi:SusC/RagA family TonB-linked outer membrane protein [Pedobacter sp. MC2016-14]|uniref:SusC/RagA family TonB-linked outer membrane protein n=1 Tax=Pedobacter sp. MC2016-14 TaxID=2897327 RepID=UPI001E4B033F|nr:SusC/RagA family TonB-linked outer membrane protein [Pedobacter sp. MC2016-14]MCD0487781.1 SusC/RagA family TonB-linked outer membrane protein [Pedobacter sp. MC2016-14]
MKLTTFILIVALAQVSAKGYAQKITLNGRNIPLENILKSIRQQSGYEFIYDVNELKNQRITVVLSGVSVEEAIKEAIKDLPLSYKIINKNIVLTKNKPSLIEKIVNVMSAINIHGIVVDDKGRPLSGATIVVNLGENILARSITDAKGEFYARSVQEESKVSISYIGYKTQVLDAKTEMGRITLQPGQETLNEVSVVLNNGYVTLSKERSAGSFAKADMKIVADRTTSTNLLQRLEGQLPGLVINNSGGGAPVLVRGLTTIPTGARTNTAPLYIVDNVPVADLSNINPEDVADVTLLRDATAASIWGARAANGVIVVTTKRGERNNRVTASYRGSVNFPNKPDFGYVPYLNSRQYVQVAEELYNIPQTAYSPSYLSVYPLNTVSTTNAGGMAPHDAILYSSMTVAQKRAALDSLGSVNNRDQILDLWYRDQMNLSHTVNIQGGGNRYNFYASGAFTNNISSVIGTKDNMYQTTINQDFTVNNFISLSLNSRINYGLTSSKRAPASIGAAFLPYQIFRDASGNNINMPWIQSYPEAIRLDFQNRSRIDLNYNPLDEIERGSTSGNNLSVSNQLGTRINLFKGLRFDGTYSFARTTVKSESFDAQNSYRTRTDLLSTTQNPATPGGVPVYNYPTLGGIYETGNNYVQNWTIRNSLSYENSWTNGLHRLNALAGQEANETKSNGLSTRVRGWDRDLLRSTQAIDWYRLGNAGIGNRIVSNTTTIISDGSFNDTGLAITRFTSYFGNLAYTFNNKYSLNASIRADQSNLFGLDKSAQNRPVWSIGGRWTVSDEKFMAQAEWLSSLALRLTYGIAGNAPSPGTAASDDILARSTSNFSPGSTALEIATPANRTLTWERTATKNLGLDFGFLRGRITGTIDAYYRKTEDLLGSVITHSLTGYPSVTGNIGTLENKGVEFSLSTRNVESAAFRWGTNFNFAFNKNQITSVNPATPVTSASGRIAQQFVNGYEAFAMWAYRFAGLDHDFGDPLVRKADGTIIKAPSGNTIPRAEDVMFMGTTQPKWSGGLTNTFNYKQFSLSANAIFNFGHVMRNDINTFYSGRLYAGSASNFAGNIHPDFLQRWKQPGDEAFTNIPSYVPGTTSLSRRNTDYYTQGDINVLDASYVKLRDISIAYSLPTSIIRRLALQQVTIRSNINNLPVIWAANHEGIDPDYGGGFTRSSRPKQGTLSFGLDVRF